MKVGFIGIGKLGLIAAEVMSSKHEVVGYDTSHVVSDKIKVVSSMAEVCKDRDIIFIAVPTPHEKEYEGNLPCMHLKPKDFDYSIVKEVLAEANKHVTRSQLVVLISTVLPGTIRRELQPLITAARFIYNPYLIAMGSVAWDMVNPEMIIIGTDTGDKTQDAKVLMDFYDTLVTEGTRYEIGTWDEAESIKVFYNTFISTKIGLVNMIQDVAEKSGNINVDIVTSALSRSTHRITGPAYLKAGLGDAGGCHPRDNIALRYLAENLELGYDMFEMIMKAREQQAKNMAQKLISLSKEYKLPIWIHGKAFKPSVSYIDGSYSLLVGHYVELENIPVQYVDPLTGDCHDAIKGVVLMAHHAPTTYRNVQSECPVRQITYCHIEPGSILLDPWRYLLNDEVIEMGCTLVQYGNSRLRDK